MRSVESLVRDANPIPDATTQFSKEDVAALLHLTREGNGDMDTREVRPTKPQQEKKSRSGWFVAGGAFASIVGVAIIAALLARGGSDPAVTTPSPTSTTSSTTATTTIPIIDAADIASSFLQARSAYDTDAAVASVASDAVIDIGPAQDVATLPQEMRWQEASGLLGTNEGCQADTATSGNDTAVTCLVRVESPILEANGSDPIRFTYEFLVSDGLISSATLADLGSYSTDIWEPFHDWVLAHRADSYRSMFAAGGTTVILSDESIDLWRRFTDEYAKETSFSAAFSSVQAYLDARSRGDVEEALSYLASDALLDWGPGTSPDELADGLAWEQALGISFEPIGCVVIDGSADADAGEIVDLSCTTAVTSAISEAVGDPGGVECITVRVEGGLVTYALMGADGEGCHGFSFAAKVFDPFTDWLAVAHPELSFDTLYLQRTSTDDVALWRQLTEEFVADAGG